MDDKRLAAAIKQTRKATRKPIPFEAWLYIVFQIVKRVMLLIVLPILALWGLSNFPPPSPCTYNFDNELRFCR